MVTPETAAWWQARLRHEAYMHFGKQVRCEKERIALFPEEEKSSMLKYQAEFQQQMGAIFGRADSFGSSADFSNLIPATLREAEGFYSHIDCQGSGSFGDLFERNEPLHTLMVII